MDRWSHREFEARLAWAEYQWNQPDRTDYYLMQIAAEVRRVLHKNPANVKTAEFKLKFEKEGGDDITHESAKERTRRSMLFFAPLIQQAVTSQQGAEDAK